MGTEQASQSSKCGRSVVASPRETGLYLSTVYQHHDGIDAQTHWQNIYGMKAQDAGRDAAFGWTFQPERTDDYMASGLYRLRHLADISHSCVCCHKKMKQSAVMPHIVGTRLQLRARDIADEPMDIL